MIKKLSNIGALLILLAMTACTENKIEGYTNDPAIYFLNGKTYEADGTQGAATPSQKDSINQSFFVSADTVTREVVYVFVKTMGMLADVDRPVKLIQANSGAADAAVPGVHYVPFDAPEVVGKMVVPAGRSYARIPIILLRDKSLQTSEKRLELEVAPNEYFRPGIDQYRHFTITTTDLAVKPALWDRGWKYYFGSTFGSVKFKFIINATGYTDWETLPSDYSYIKWLQTTVLQAFYDYNQQHPDEPLKEADGTLVTFE